MALDATVSGAAANSYITQAAATAYLADRLDIAAWTAATSAEKDAALIMATTRLDTEDYIGSRVFISQRLRWPRYGATDPDGLLYDHLTIPNTMLQATCELALAIIGQPSLMTDTGLESFINVKMGSLDVTPRFIAAARLPALVKRLIAPVRLGGYSTPVYRA